MAACVAAPTARALSIPQSTSTFLRSPASEPGMYVHVGASYEAGWRVRSYSSLGPAGDGAPSNKKKALRTRLAPTRVSCMHIILHHGAGGLAERRDAEAAAAERLGRFTSKACSRHP